jgi:hypothetical protein
MTSIEEAESWIGRTAIDDTGEQIGMITQIWVDDATDRPEWASVNVPGLRGPREVLVPLTGSVALGGGRQFTFTLAEIAGAPDVAQNGHLEVEEKEQLCAYYGAPAADAPRQPRAASWADRMEDQVRRTPAAAPAQGPAEAAAPPKPRRFGRKPTATDEKAKRRFGRKRPSAAPAIEPMEPDEILV